MQGNSSKNYSVKTIIFFERQAKKLKKKFPFLSSDLLSLIEDLEEEPIQGVSLGKNCYKIRLAITSKGKGKSGGARVIVNVVVSDEVVYLLSIYDKLDKENISDKEFEELLKQLDDFFN